MHFNTKGKAYACLLCLPHVDRFFFAHVFTCHKLWFCLCVDMMWHRHLPMGFVNAARGSASVWLMSFSVNSFNTHLLLVVLPFCNQFKVKKKCLHPILYLTVTLRSYPSIHLTIIGKINMPHFFSVMYLALIQHWQFYTSCLLCYNLYFCLIISKYHLF